MDVLEEEYDYGQYPVCVGMVVEDCPEGQEQAGHWWWYWKRQGAEDGLRFVWRASFYGTQWQQYPVPCRLQLAGHKEGFELVDREFAIKVARKDGRKSKLAVVWKVEVLAVTDARGTGEKPCSNGIRDIQPKSLSPRGHIG